MIGEMVILLLIKNQSHEAVLCLLIPYIHSFFSGRGVDLNRNWSVDWGKKEKVSVSVFSCCAQENQIIFYVRHLIEIHVELILSN